MHKKQIISLQFFLLSVVFGLTVLIFSPTFLNDFQQTWDDNWQVLENPYIVDISWETFSFHFVKFYKGQYSPINTLLYSVIHNFFGFSPIAFHGFSLFVHLLNAGMVFFFIQEVAAQVTSRINGFGKNFYAFITALIFALHPLQVESVAWISASKVVVYSFFTLLALLAYLRYIKTERRFWLLLVGVAYLLSFGSKEQAIILPLNLLSIDYVFGRLKGHGFQRLVSLKKIIIEKILFFVLAIGMWYFSMLNNLGSLTKEGISYPFYQRFLFGAHSISEYLFRFLAPVKLYYFYFFPMEIGKSIPWYYWCYPMIFFCIVFFIGHHHRRKNKIVLFGLLFFLINILLVLHILPMPRETITADRYMYLSIVGLSLILAWIIDYVVQHYLQYRKLIIAILSIYIVALSIQSFVRTQDWKDSDHIKHNIKVLIEKRERAGQSVIKNTFEDE